MRYYTRHLLKEIAQEFNLPSYHYKKLKPKHLETLLNIYFRFYLKILGKGNVIGLKHFFIYFKRKSDHQLLMDDFKRNNMKIYISYAKKIGSVKLERSLNKQD